MIAYSHPRHGNGGVVFFWNKQVQCVKRTIQEDALVEELVVLDKVSKTFGQHSAILEVTCHISRGECVAVTGTNGSGKSTFLHLIAGLALPSRGKRIVKFSNLRIGYVPERFPSLRFSPQQYLLHIAQIQGMNTQSAIRSIEGMMSLFQMQQYAERSMHHFSKGMLQKVNLMQAMISAPDLLLLDEPLSGLDEVSQHEMVSVLGEIKHQGTAIVMSVHEPLLIAALADRIIVLKQGRMIRDALNERKETYQGIRLIFHNISPEAMMKLEKLNGFMYWVSRGTPAEVVIDRNYSDHILLFVLTAGGSVISLQTMTDEQVERSNCTLNELQQVMR